MPAVPTTTLYMTIGSDFSTIVDLCIDLTGFEVLGTMKRSYYTSNGVDFNIEVSDVENGTLTLSLPHEIVNTLVPTRYVFTIVIKSIGDIIYPVLEGVIIVNPSATVNTNII